MVYNQRFINQSIKIPDTISDKVDSIYTSQNSKIRNCIKIIVANLRAQNIVAYSTRSQHYAKHHTKNYTKAYFLQAVELVKEGGYVDTDNGSKDITFETGFSSRLIALPKLQQDFPYPVKNQVNVRELPYLFVDDKPIWKPKDLVMLKSCTAMPSSSQPSASPLPPSSLLLPLRLYLRVSRELNHKYFHQMKLDFSNVNTTEQCLEEVHLSRVIINGECGRWYQSRGYSYQELPKEERTKILLNGMEVKELDYSASHPNILYFWENQQAPEDFYGLVISDLAENGYPEITKQMVKSVILTSINARSLQQLSRAINKDKRTELKANIQRKSEGRPERLILYDELMRINLQPKTIIEAFVKVHPALAKYIYSASANKLMWEESKIMTSALIKLMEMEIPALPIHDSFLFQAPYYEEVKKVMLDCYRRHTGFQIQVK